MSKKTWGVFEDAFGEDDRIFTGGRLAKAVDADDIDLEAMCTAMETLNRRARTMNKAQLDRLNYKVGLAVNRFKAEVTKYITRQRGSMNQGTLEKVQRGTGDVSDAGLDERRETPTGNFTKVSHAGDMGDPFGEDDKEK